MSLSSSDVDPSRRQRYTDMFNRTYRPTLAYVLRRTGSEADAHDIVSEVYLVAWRRFAELETKDHEQAWLYAVAYRVLLNSQRKSAFRSRLQKDVASQTLVAGDTTSSNVEQNDELRRVIESLQRLSPRDREALRLVAFEGLSHREISEVMGISRTLVRSVIHRARRRLARELYEHPTRHPGTAEHNYESNDPNLSARGLDESDA